MNGWKQLEEISIRSGVFWSLIKSFGRICKLRLLSEKLLSESMRCTREKPLSWRFAKCPNESLEKIARAEFGMRRTQTYSFYWHKGRLVFVPPCFRRISFLGKFEELSCCRCGRNTFVRHLFENMIAFDRTVFKYCLYAKPEILKNPRKVPELQNRRPVFETNGNHKLSQTYYWKKVQRIGR